MPESSEQKGQEKVQASPHAPLLIPPERDIDIIPQKSRERDMPTSPEILDALGFIRREEIDRQVNVKTQGSSDCHINIAAKIEIELK